LLKLDEERRSPIRTVEESKAERNEGSRGRWPGSPPGSRSLMIIREEKRKGDKGGYYKPEQNHNNR